MAKGKLRKADGTIVNAIVLDRGLTRKEEGKAQRVWYEVQPVGADAQRMYFEQAEDPQWSPDSVVLVKLKYSKSRNQQYATHEQRLYVLTDEEAAAVSADGAKAA